MADPDFAAAPATAGARNNLHAAVAVNLICGLVMGIGIGFTPSTLQVAAVLANCTARPTATDCAYVGPGGAGAAVGGACVWFHDGGGGGTCRFPDGLHCEAFGGDRVACEEATPSAAPVANAHGGESVCAFTGGRCRRRHGPGWSPTRQAFFAGSLIVGSMTGAVLARKVNARWGRRAAVRWLVAAVPLLGTALTALVWGVAGPLSEGGFVGLAMTRVLCGVGCGASAVTGPLYVGDVAPRRHAHWLEAAMQGVICFSIALMAWLGWAVIAATRPDAPSGGGDGGNPAALASGFQGLYNGAPWLVSLAAVAVGAAMPESAAWLAGATGHHVDGADPEVATAEGSSIVSEELPSAPKSPAARPLLLTRAVNNDETAAAACAAVASYGAAANANISDSLIPGGGDEHGESSMQPTRAMTKRQGAVVAALIACGIQFTGINAVLNWAPALAEDVLGIGAMPGSAAIATWNFVATFASLPLAARVADPRVAFTRACAVASVASLLTGVPTLPAVGLSDTARRALGAVGVAAFVFIFQASIGPLLYVLAQGAFPPPLRTWGCAATQLAQFGFNLVLNVAFPLSVAAIDAASHRPGTGLAAMFIVFGFFGGFTAYALRVAF